MQNVPEDQNKMVCFVFVYQN